MVIAVLNLSDDLIWIFDDLGSAMAHAKREATKGVVTIVTCEPTKRRVSKSLADLCNSIDNEVVEFHDHSPKARMIAKLNKAIEKYVFVVNDERYAVTFRHGTLWA